MGENRLAHAVPDQHHGIADFHLRVPDFAVFLLPQHEDLLRTQPFFHVSDQRIRILRHEKRRHGMKPFRHLRHRTLHR